MNLDSVRKTFAALAIAAVGFSPVANAQHKKHRGGGGGESSSPTMTFDVDQTDQAANPAPTKSKRGKQATTTGEGQAAVAASDAPAGPPSKTLDRAIKLYDNEDYYSASIELNKVVEGQTQDDEANKQKAEFFMGKTLFKLGFYSASLSYFDRIVQKGAGHRYYTKTLEWLASLSLKLPESAGVLEKIGKYTRADLDSPALEMVRDELYYLLGRYHYTKANWKDALDLLGAIPEKSEYFAQAKFLEGMTYVREQANEPDEAKRKEETKATSEAFKAILRKAKENPDKKTSEFEELANISLARTFYALGQYQLATKYYDRVEQMSPLWPTALFEASWAEFQMDGDSRALGNIHTLNSPYFEQEFYPEAFILKAVVYFQRCNYDRAMEAVKDFNEVYPGLKKDIDSIVAKYPDNAEFYNYVMKIRAADAELPERVQRAAEGALSDKTLLKMLDYVSELDRELKQVEKADPAWSRTAIAGNILQDLTLQKSLAANDAGNLARERLKRLSSEIQEQVKQSIKVEYETLNATKGVIEAKIKEEQQQSNNLGKKVFGDIVVDDEHERWPFEGEYWKDELGYYRFRVANKCSANQ